jgi:mannose-6-phosphate isomerase
MSDRIRQSLYALEPQYRERVWGGQRLKPQQPPIGEVWCAFDQSRVASGPHTGALVAGVATDLGPAFLGDQVHDRFGNRFPLLIKILDCADWLSVQVHPTDEHARRLVGPDQFGKTEAWHFIDTEPGATILAGARPGTSQATLEQAIRNGKVLDVASSVEVHVGETFFLPAGTMHALGPGLLLYEVQQSSDITYRIYDWGRPVGLNRALHVEESVIVTNAQRVATRTPPPQLDGTATVLAVTCSFFELDVLQIADTTLRGDTSRQSFHVLTAIAGAVSIRSSDDALRLDRFESAIVAGGAGAYEIRSLNGPARVLRASVPAG